VFKREGFISSPLEERARLLHAMSQEMSNTLTHIDGVITARVHLVVPERNPLSDQPLPASASVFIKHRADRSLADQVPQIKALVVNSIEGLSYENVTVALFSAEPLTRRPRAMVVPAQARTLNTPTLAGGGLGLIASISGGLLWWRAGRQRRSEQQPVGARQLMSTDRST
jgi:type III secretion protein J